LPVFNSEPKACSHPNPEVPTYFRPSYGVQFFLFDFRARILPTQNKKAGVERSFLALYRPVKKWIVEALKSSE
jgi:hypothetical protein